MRSFSQVIESRQSRIKNLMESAKVDSREDLVDYASTVMKEAHGSKYDQKIVDKMVDDLIREHGSEDFGKIIGIIQASLNESRITFEERFERFVESLVKDPKRVKYDLLEACSTIDQRKTVRLTAEKLVSFLGLINTDSRNMSLLESIGLRPSQLLNEVQAPEHAIAIVEALENALIYVGADTPARSQVNSVISLSRTVRTDYSKELNEITGAMSSDRLIFDRYLKDRLNTYTYSVAKLPSIVKNMDYFVLLCISYLDKFIDINFDRLNTRGFNDNIEQCRMSLQSYKEVSPLYAGAVNTNIAYESINFSKLYQTWELLCNMQAIAPSRLKPFIKQYAFKVKPMLDSIRIWVELQSQVK